MTQMTSPLTKLALAACVGLVGLLGAPRDSAAECKGKLTIKNYGNHALLIDYIALDLKRDAGKAWVKAWEGNLSLDKNESVTIKYRQPLITNCNKASKSFQLHYQAQRGSTTNYVSSTNYERGHNFTITRTGRTEFRLSKGK